MHRATDIVHEAGGHKQIAIDAAMGLHRVNQPVNLELEPKHFTDEALFNRQVKLKGAADKLGKLVLSADSMHEEVQRHMKTLYGPIRPTLLDEARNVRNALEEVPKWAMDHGEDAPGAIKNGKKYLQYGSMYDQPTMKLMSALHSTRKKVQDELAKNPRRAPPAQSLLNHAREMTTSPSRGGSSRPHH